jgi:uncharacterized membrane protein
MNPLMVLDVRLPQTELVHSNQDWGTTLVALGRQMVKYMTSFLTLGILWVGQQTPRAFGSGSPGPKAPEGQ